MVILAAGTFVSLALLLAARMRAEIVLAVANLVYLIMVVGGGLVIGLDRYPVGLQTILMVLPTAALGEGLRAAAGGQVLGWPLLVLLVWLTVSAAGAVKGFRWM